MNRLLVQRHDVHGGWLGHSAALPQVSDELGLRRPKLRFGARQPPATPEDKAATPGGFTLVELLAVVSIIAILAGIVLGALGAARQTARAARTKSLIARLDQVIMRRYESYRTRRVPISTRGLKPTEAAEVRLRAIRELMRMEMPERPSDVSDPAGVDDAVDLGFACELRRTGLARMFFGEYIAHPPNEQYNSSELLYMIVMLGSTEDREHFTQREIADVDSDGLPEFIDGWGNPIAFLRWAPGFSTESDIQSGDPVHDHDPFDTRNVDPDAYRLTPLIYSAGADGIYDINRQITYRFADASGFSADPYYESSSQPNNSGQPIDSETNTSVTAPGKKNGSLDHYDNIHNHHIEQR